MIVPYLSFKTKAAEVLTFIRRSFNEGGLGVLSLALRMTAHVGFLVFEFFLGQMRALGLVRSDSRPARSGYIL